MAVAVFKAQLPGNKCQSLSAIICLELLHYYEWDFVDESKAISAKYCIELAAKDRHFEWCFLSKEKYTFVIKVYEYIVGLF